jgi:hypothetical protein
MSSTHTDHIDVPQLLTRDEIQFFVENGYLVKDGLITPDDVEELRREVVTIARGKYPCENIKPIPDTVTDAEAVKNILCIHQPHFVSPVIRTYVRHPNVCGVLGQITAAHLPYWDGSVKCMQSMFFVKPPGFQGQAWHQDEVYIPTRDRSLIGAWMALDDATIANGCLWVIPGSHRMGYMYPQRQHNNPDEFDTSRESHGFNESLEVPVEVKTGTVVFFNGYLLHRSRKNRTTDCYRRVLVNHYCNAWSLLPWRLGKDETMATADVREIVPVAGVDPYAWKGTVTPPQKVYLRKCQANQDAT